MGYWEFALFLILTGIGIIPLLRFGMRGAGEGFVGAFLILVTSVFAMVFWPQPPIHVPGAVVARPQWFRNDEPTRKFVPRTVKSDGYVSAETCRSCHPKFHASWHATYHRTMTQVATPHTVADAKAFDNKVIKVGKRTYKLTTAGDQFWIEGADMDWAYREVLQGKEPLDTANPPVAKRRIVMTTGSHHFQVYWVAAEKRGYEMLQTPLVWGIETKQWIPAEDVFIRPPTAGQRVVMWNRGCIQCHSVHAQPGLTGIDSVFNSTVSDLGISCEACHGPGKKHVDFYRNPLNRYRAFVASTEETKPTIINPAKLPPEKAAQVCGQCHVAFAPKSKDWNRTGVGYEAGGDYSLTHHILAFDDPLGKKLSAKTLKASYWGDGTMRAAGREYGALLESACYKRGHGNQKMHCLSCHTMHGKDPNDQLWPRMRGNVACTQCHNEAKYNSNIAQHTHHKSGSSGSNCYNCHMPNISYGLLRGMRSHRITIPSATHSQKFGKPNGCNQCHIDKSLVWTADHLRSWFGIDSEKLKAEYAETSATLLWALKGDAAQRALAAWTMGWKPARQTGGEDWTVPALAQLLVDPYAAVRYIAYGSLKKQPGYQDIQYNFVGPEADREKVRQQVLDIWKNKKQPLLPKANAKTRSILILGSGRDLLMKRWQELLKQRDNTDLEFPE